MASSSEDADCLILSRIHHQDVNYDEVKTNYTNLVHLHKNKLKPLCTRDAIEETITHITLDPESANYLSVKDVNGVKKLFLRKTKRTMIQVLPVEDSFDILLDAHIVCGHGGSKETWEQVRKAYSVHILCVRWIVSSCNVCNLAKGANQKPEENMRQTETVPKVLNKPAGISRTRGIWRLNFMKDKYGATKDIKSYLLILKEDTTNFLVLRPIYDFCGGFAMELVKIFTEFGYPERVFVHNMLDFFKHIFDLVNLLNPADKVTVVKTNNYEVFSKDREEVLNEIKNWMCLTGDAYWEQSCHLVQYKLNTTEKLFTRLYSDQLFVGIPFNQFFEYWYKTKMTFMPSPFVRRNEEWIESSDSSN